MQQTGQVLTASVIQKYEAKQEILVADGPQVNTSDDNAHGKE
jgi:hypothetical protein